MDIQGHIIDHWGRGDARLSCKIGGCLLLE